MSSLMQRLHRFIYDDICEEVENIMVTVCFTYLSIHDVVKTVSILNFTARRHASAVYAVVVSVVCHTSVFY